MQLRQADPSETETVIALPWGDGVLAMTEEGVRREFAAGRMRPEWTWVAVDDNAQVIGRALWWGRDDNAPITLDVLDVAGDVDAPVDVGASLLRAGHDALAAMGHRPPLPYTVRLPVRWWDRPNSVAAVEWRTQAAAAAGLTQVNERLQFEWSRVDHASSPSDTRPSRIALHPGSDEDFLRLFVQVTRGSLDVMTRRSVAATSVEEAARDDLDFYLSCPGERSWWRVATDSLGDPIGFVIPSATPYTRNVGYLGVLPDQRGHGYVDDLLTYVTEFHRVAGAQRITATTDAVNLPMAVAFARCGYRTIETRMDLEAPSH